MVTRTTRRPSRRVSGKAWLSRSMLVRPWSIGALWIGHLRVRHLRVRPWGKARACLGKAWLSISSCWWVWPPGGLVIIGRGHSKTWLRGPVNIVMERVALTHYGVSTLVLGHGVEV